MTSITIGRLAEQCGVSAKTVRFYERIGLLPPPARTASGYRLYGDDALRRLTLIRSARRLGLPLSAIQRLLAEAEATSCGDFRHRLLTYTTRQLLELDRRLSEIERLRGELLDFQARLEADVAGERAEAVLACRDCACFSGAPPDP